MSKNKTNTHRLPLGIIVLSIVFIYLTYHTVSYFTRDKISSFEIGSITSLSANNTYTGLIIRDESITTSSYSGDLSLLLKTGTRVSKDDNVCLVDESGGFTKYLQSALSSGSLNSNDYKNFTEDIRTFSLSYNPSSFNKIYEFKSSTKNHMLGLIDVYSEAGLNALGLNTTAMHLLSTENSGVVEYYTDGFESFDVSTVSADSFNKALYTRTDIKSGTKVAAGDKLFKTVNSEEWSILVPLTEEDALQYSEKKRVKVLFNETGLSTTVLFEIIKGSDGASYGKLTLTKYMIRYVNERYLKITILSDSPTGLKLPKSSLVTAEFYTVPLSYLTKGGASTSDGFNLESYEGGQSKVTFISPSISYKDEEYAYISVDQLTSGSMLIKSLSNEKYQIGSTVTLTGVYNINKGYAAFKVINILDSNDNYVIAQRGTYAGIYEQDYILLKGDEGYQNKIIYQ